MGWSGQEDGMDVMKEIIQKEIQSISSLEERVIFKNLMEGVFLSLYDTNREMYEGLERRIKEELDYDKNRYYVKTGIVEREFFDASHHLLSPMDESDLAEKLYDMKGILRAVEESIEPVKCIENGTPICETADSCSTLPIWKGLSALINNYLNSITLADAVNYKDEGEDVT